MLDEATTSWCTIHRDRISRNLELALGLVPQGRKFCAVLKADAYGHGIAQVVPLVREQGVTSIGITSNAEARAVRAAGFRGTLIRLRVATPQEIEGALGDRVEEQVASMASARHIRNLLDEGKRKTSAHLALNVAGISRDALEMSSETGQNTCRDILDILGPHICGICSHFPSNEPGPLRSSADLFHSQVSWVFDNSNLKRPDILVHAGSTLTLVSETSVETDMYRCGAILYGIVRPDLGFLPAMDLEARIISLQHYPKGVRVGYDGACQLERDSRLACISIGYENGFRREALGRGMVAVRNALAPVIGKTSMNAIVADVTDIDDVEIGETVGIFRTSDAASILPAHAESQFGTIMADLYTDWGRRNHRVYC